MKSVMAVVAAGLLLAVWPAPGQETATSPRSELAERLLKAMGTDTMLEQSFENIKKQMPAYTEQMAREMGTKIPPEVAAIQKEYTEKLMQMISEELRWDRIKADLIALYAGTFTEEELKGLIEFYQSPLGRSFTAKQPELMKKSMEITQALMMRVMPKMRPLMEEMRQKMQEVQRKQASPPEPAR